MMKDMHQNDFEILTGKIEDKLTIYCRSVSIHLANSCCIEQKQAYVNMDTTINAKFLETV